MNSLHKQWQLFKNLLRNAFKDLLPIVIVITIFQIGVFESVPENWQHTVIGLLIVGVAMALFLYGLELGIFPVGESLAKAFAGQPNSWILYGFALLIGYGTTIAEPTLIVIADKAMVISQGRMDNDILRQVVAFSVGFAVFLGVFRIVKGHPIHYYIISGYLIAMLITYFTPKEMIGLSYDLGGVTTSTVTVPLIAALGIGLASSIKGRDPIIDGFGLIAFASIMPMVFVQLYGIWAFNLIDPTVDVQQLAEIADKTKAFTVSPSTLFSGLTDAFKDILPVILVMLFFHYVVLRKQIANLQSALIGFLLTVIGLYAFILGLNLGLFSLGEAMATQLVAYDNVWMIYIFAFAIGFATTMAEPALMTIAHKAKEISHGKIDDWILRCFVAIGVATGIALGCYRIVHGHSILNYILVGYAFVVGLTFIAPRHIIPIAYDSGGVTTSTVTVPLVAALGIGLSSTIPGRDILIDGFGLIAFASLFPMIKVLIYGIIVERWGHLFVISDTDTTEKQQIQSLAKDTKNLPLLGSYQAIIAIVDEADVYETIEIAKKFGAGGVTILDSDGVGIRGFNSQYRSLMEVKSKMLIFIVPQKLVKNIIQATTESLNLNDKDMDTHGIVFSVSISDVYGIGLRQQSQFADNQQTIISSP